MGVLIAIMISFIVLGIVGFGLEFWRRFSEWVGGLVVWVVVFGYDCRWGGCFYGFVYF